MKTEAGPGVMGPQAREHWSHQELEEVGRTCPRSPRKERGPADTLRLASGLQSWGIQFCRSKPSGPVLCTAALGNAPSAFITFAVIDLTHTTM